MENIGQNNIYNVVRGQFASSRSGEGREEMEEWTQTASSLIAKKNGTHVHHLMSMSRRRGGASTSEDGV